MKISVLKPKSVPTFLLLIILSVCLAAAAAFAAFSDYSLIKEINNFFGWLFVGKTPWQKIAIASLLIGIGNCLLLPISALLLATALFLPGWQAFGACMLGSLVAAGIGYVYGRYLDFSYLKTRFGKKYEMVLHEIGKEGLKSVIILCYAPVAPNLLTNMLAGVCRIPLWKLFLGTFIGFMPGVALLTLLGREIRQMFEDPGLQTILWLVALGALFFVSYKIGKRIQKRLQ